MKHYMMIGFVFALVLSFAGCNPGDQNTETGEDVEYIPMRTNDGTDQHVSNDVKNILREYEEIKTVKAVNTPKTVIVAVEIKHSKRLKLEEHEKSYEEALQKAFPDMIIELSTDKKLVIEIDRLEHAIKEKSISRKKLEIKIQKLIKMMNKKT
ncbi:hypothetical protein JNUCC1_00106 [Lentibacillus sp. JNUCC-1]|uniref:YhcN/YlaJ family sporulation lipoprotein n=1 Tax=Lentibacillus sp. JNUCC-1 TaxID=2654513 RepID=UPI0012E798D7|nr:YhcN/YlaJ family sporulation lipoprotein [Lentibacillus sp. JNUCC-1]MUV36305.1 hypothetical protein [Lentibacillus sp. JNUCC-1]